MRFKSKNRTEVFVAEFSIGNDTFLMSEEGMPQQIDGTVTVVFPPPEQAITDVFRLAPIRRTFKLADFEKEFTPLDPEARLFCHRVFYDDFKGHWKRGKTR